MELGAGRTNDASPNYLMEEEDTISFSYYYHYNNNNNNY